MKSNEVKLMEWVVQTIQKPWKKFPHEQSQASATAVTQYRSGIYSIFVKKLEELERMKGGSGK